MSRLALLLACLMLPPSVARAADFAPTSRDWNGLNDLQSVAGLVDLHIQPRTTVDFAQVDEQDVLLVVAPQVAPTGVALDSLRRFVESGGRLIVADDFAAGAKWLAPFGLTLQPEPGHALQH